MEKIDFDNDKPYFQDKDVKWFISSYFHKYIYREQDDNLPALSCLEVFVVKDHEVNYVLVNDQQQYLAIYPYNLSGMEQMTAKINILKISKHFDDYEL